eukprot:TRINITY_DN2587_c0_g1_i1.p1 TRINITY_DN2587_c0_g1~~TRINITY_DN2587_c0_g1_i1.p1  ORF type:complete len:321 (-),score=44.57 TRINITY_DN2587_c0_g1_i1:7-945(-)
MGQSASKPSHSTLPPRISVSAVLRGCPRARKELCESFQEHGYAVLKPERSTVTTINRARMAAAGFLAKPQDFKRQWELEADSDVTGPRRRNRGFVPGTDREYFKVRMIDKDESYPPGLQQPLGAAMEWMYKLLWTCFLQLAQGPVPTAPSLTDKFPPIKNYSMEELKQISTPKRVDVNEDTTRWAPQSTVAVMYPFVPEGSSISIIRYFNQGKSGHQSCEEHHDTGLLTCVMAGEVPGLEIYDDKFKEWVEVEALCPPGDLLLMPGRKLELFACLAPERALRSAFHRVSMPANLERHSILFFMDVPAGPDKD